MLDLREMSRAGERLISALSLVCLMNWSLLLNLDAKILVFFNTFYEIEVKHFFVGLHDLQNISLISLNCMLAIFVYAG